MAAHYRMAALAAAAGALGACSSPLDRQSHDLPRWADRAMPEGAQTPPSAYARNGDPSGAGSPRDGGGTRGAPRDGGGTLGSPRDGGGTRGARDEWGTRAGEGEADGIVLGPSSAPDDYIRYALFHNPGVEAAYQQWRAAGERLPQVGALPDPRLMVGFFLDEVETRVGPQQARLGAQQTLPWPQLLSGRRDAAASAARAAWRRFEGARLETIERTVAALHELAWLDAAIGIAEENLSLLRSFEEIIRARYRVGAGGHPELIRAQVELGQVEDRLTQLRALRPSYVADLNAILNRPAGTEVAPLPPLPAPIVDAEPEALIDVARRLNPALLALDESVEEQRSMTGVASASGLPELTVGLDYIVTGEAMDSSIPESGDDPILLTFGVNLPLWRGKYDAAVREATARRFAIAHARSNEANRVAAAIHRAWFQHTDADRRVRLYESTLIPTAERSLRASLAGFRAGGTSFLDLLDTERTLLEFALAAERARADRGKALATLNTLIGQEAPLRGASEPADRGVEPLEITDPAELQEPAGAPGAEPVEPDGSPPSAHEDNNQ